MPRALLALTLIVVLVLVPTPVALAQTAEGCQPGEAPHFTFGFAMLKDQVGEDMGDPVTCEFSDPNGTGDVHQRTTTGLAFWRKSTNTPTFTDGFNHWAQTPQGWITWTGASVDPPLANVYPDTIVQGFLGGCQSQAPNDAQLASACNCAIQRIQATYSLTDFLSISANYIQEGTFPPDFTALVATCA
ncbi:MAG: hypothetical protein JO318_03645 [Chloroflexi bacterium]|nr:hypothetical protein [Chloroflexota bacterium]MBV9131761.1 hypothetical protein [Chloroflexota bacterium]